MTGPREEYIAAARQLEIQTARVLRRLAVQKEQLDELHGLWSRLIGGTLNQAAGDVLILLADAGHHADLAAARAMLATEEMRRYVDGI